jgi:hypothetical protein
MADPMTVAQFRETLTAFEDPEQYSDGEVSFWLGIAASTLDPIRWGDFWGMGQAFFAAHNLVLSARDRRTAEAGGIPGAPTGVMSSKSVGSVSASYDTQLGQEQDPGQWALTSFGNRYLYYARQVGAGGVQVNPDSSMAGQIVAPMFPLGFF